VVTYGNGAMIFLTRVIILIARKKIHKGQSRQVHMSFVVALLIVPRPVSALGIGEGHLRMIKAVTMVSEFA